MIKDGEVPGSRKSFSNRTGDFSCGQWPHITGSSDWEGRGLLGTSIIALQVSRHVLLGSRRCLGAGAWAGWQELTLECSAPRAGLEQAHSLHTHLGEGTQAPSHDLKARASGLPKCHRKSSLEYCFEKVHPSPRAHAPPCSSAVEEAPRKVPLLPLGLQAGAKRKKPPRVPQEDGQPLPSHRWPHLAEHLPQVPAGEGHQRCSEPAFQHLLSLHWSQARTRWHSRPGLFYSPTSPWQPKQSPAINMFLSRRRLCRNRPFLQDSSARIPSSC